MEVFRLCLKDKSSILVEALDLYHLHQKLESKKFIMSRDGELISVDYIWAVRKSSKEIGDK